MITHETANIFIDDHGHVRFNFVDRARVEYHHMADYLKIFAELCGDQKRCFILDTRGTHATGTAEARKFVGKHPDALKWRKADAILLDSLSVKLVGNFYMKLEVSDHPVKLFKDETAALNWLSQF